MTLKADQEQVKALLTETITLLCKNGLHFKSEFCVEGLIGITLDRSEVFLISIKETVCSDQPPAESGSSLVGDSDANEPENQEKQNGIHETPDAPPSSSNPEQVNNQLGADGSSVLSVTDGHNLAEAVAVTQMLPPPIQKYQRSCSNVVFHSFEDLLPQNDADLRSSDEYDLSLLAHSACVYGQHEGALSTKLQNAEAGEQSRDEYVGVFAEDFSRHIESERLNSGQVTEGMATTGDLQDDGQTAAAMERPAKRQCLEGVELTLAGSLDCGIMESVASRCGEEGGVLTAERKTSQEIVGIIKEEPNLDGLSLAYSGMQAGHFDLEGNQTFPFASSQSHMPGNHQSALTSGCSILDGDGLDLQSQATRLAMLHLQLPARHYSIAGKMFHCLACGKALSSLHNLKLHEATVHRGLFQYRCPLCGKGLRQERDLRGHLANRHNMKKDFRCSICGNEFGYKRNLKQHMVSYHGWKDAVVQLPL